MLQRTIIISLSLCNTLLFSSFLAAQIVDVEEIEPTLVHHSLKVILDPLQQLVSVEDTISLPDSMQGSQLRFSLNSNLRITNSSRRLERLMTDPSAVIAEYSVSPSRRNRDRLVIAYSGTIFSSPEQTDAEQTSAGQTSEEYAQNFVESLGMISTQGVYLHKGSAWLVDFGGELVSFDIQVEFADSASSWTAVSQRASDARGLSDRGRFY